MKKLFALLLVMSLVLALSVQTASAEEGATTVYFTADISPEGLQRVYDALNGRSHARLQSQFSRRLSLRASKRFEFQAVLRGNGGSC